MGASTIMPYESLKPPAWPDLPFAIVDGVPLCVYPGYALEGMAEKGEDYLAYCKANGVFRKEPFPAATSLSASNALNTLFESAAWKVLKWKDAGLGWSYTLDESYAKDRLREQLARIANPEGAADGGQPFRSGDKPKLIGGWPPPLTYAL